MWHHLTRIQKAGISLSAGLLVVLLAFVSYSSLKNASKADVLTTTSSCNVPLSAQVNTPTEGQIFTITQGTTTSISLSGEIKGRMGHTIDRVRFIVNKKPLTSDFQNQLTTTSVGNTYSSNFTADKGEYETYMSVDYDGSKQLSSPHINFSVTSTVSPSPRPSSSSSSHPSPSPSITASPSPSPSSSITPSPSLQPSARPSGFSFFNTIKTQKALAAGYTISPEGRICVTVTKAGTNPPQPVAGVTLGFTITSPSASDLFQRYTWGTTDENGYGEIVPINVALSYINSGTLTLQKAGYLDTSIPNIELKQDNNKPYSAELTTTMSEVCKVDTKKAADFQAEINDQNTKFLLDETNNYLDTEVNNVLSQHQIQQLLVDNLVSAVSQSDLNRATNALAQIESLNIKQEIQTKIDLKRAELEAKANEFLAEKVGAKYVGYAVDALTAATFAVNKSYAKTYVYNKTEINVKIDFSKHLKNVSGGVHCRSGIFTGTNISDFDILWTIKKKKNATTTLSARTNNKGNISVQFRLNKTW